jgi:hypothetical protein
VSVFCGNLRKATVVCLNPLVKSVTIAGANGSIAGVMEAMAIGGRTEREGDDGEWDHIRSGKTSGQATRSRNDTETAYHEFPKLRDSINSIC